VLSRMRLCYLWIHSKIYVFVSIRYNFFIRFYFTFYFTTQRCSTLQSNEMTLHGSEFVYCLYIINCSLVQLCVDTS
jgi:hypothetical protein